MVRFRVESENNMTENYPITIKVTSVLIVRKGKTNYKKHKTL